MATSESKSGDIFCFTVNKIIKTLKYTTQHDYINDLHNALENSELRTPLVFSVANKSLAE